MEVNEENNKKKKDDHKKWGKGKNSKKDMEKYRPTAKFTYKTRANNIDAVQNPARNPDAVQDPVIPNAARSCPELPTRVEGQTVTVTLLAGLCEIELNIEKMGDDKQEKSRARGKGRRIAKGMNGKAPRKVNHLMKMIPSITFRTKQAQPQPA